MSGSEISRSIGSTGFLRALSAIAAFLAVIVAIKSASLGSYGRDDMMAADLSFRTLLFASLVVWTTLACGLSRRGLAVCVATGFAMSLEAAAPQQTVAALSNLSGSIFGILLAFLGLRTLSSALARSRKGRDPEHVV